MSDEAGMSAVSGAYQTISDKIRALHAHGYSRSQIARHLKRHPTQVRNVIKNDELRGRTWPLQPPNPAPPSTAGVAEAATPYAGLDLQRLAHGDVYRLVLEEDGSVRMPAELTRRMNFLPGEPITAEVTAEGVMLRHWRVAGRRAQAIVRAIIPEGVDLVEELFAERRREAAREAAGE